MGTHLTHSLAEFATGLTLEAVPTNTQERVKDLLLDSLASALAGVRDADAAKVTASSRKLMGGGHSTVIGGGSLSLAGATLVNGFLITSATLCDIHYPSWCHVTPEVVPPALAVAEQQSATGRDFLVAITAGLELTTRIGLGLNQPVFHARGWHMPGVAGVFGAATSAGLLLGLECSQLTHALGIAGSQAAGSHAQAGTPTVKFQQSRAALGGLVSAQLASDGLTAMSDVLTDRKGGLYYTYSDGGSPETALAGLGSRWELEQISLRPWPLAVRVLNVVGTLLALVVGNDVHFDTVERIRVAMSLAAFRSYGDAEFSGPSGVKLSTRYLIAMVLRDRRCWPDQFTPEGLSDRALAEFARERVEIVGEARLADPAVQVDIRLANQQGLSLCRQVAHGDSSDPLDRSEIIDKFRVAAAPHLSEDKMATVVEIVGMMESQPTIQPLLAALSR